MKKYMISIGFMGVCSIILIVLLSVMTYIWKWKADIVLIGITWIYILVGFLGGRCKKRLSDEENIGKKLLEGVMVGSVFAILLFVISVFVLKMDISFNSRSFMILLIIFGSSSLGRIL